MKQEEIEVCEKSFAFAQRNQRAISHRRVISKVDIYKGSIPASKPIPPYDMKQDQEAVGVFKSLQKIIPDGIVKQIEGINKLFHCIFITGVDFDLIIGIASYIYNTHAAGSFTHLSYSGHTNQEIISDLFPPTNTFKLNYYLRGRTLFISGLGNEHQLVFKRLLGAFREINPHLGRLGYLIINVENTNILPQKLTSLSDVIRLEPEKRTESDTFNWSINSDKSEIYCNEKCVFKLPGIPFKIFKCLQEKKGKFVKNKILEKCWDKKPNYEKFLVDKMNDLKATLKNKLTEKGIKIQGEIIESKKTAKGKITAYKLPS